MPSADRRPPALALVCGGAALALVGVLAWTVEATVVRVLAALAVAVGGYVALVGVGLLRLRRAAVRANVARGDADRQAARILAAAGELAPQPGDAACGGEHTCATCAGGCALAALRS